MKRKPEMNHLPEQEDHRREQLLARGLKVTRQRMALLAALARSETPLSAEQLYLALRGQFSTLSLSTVYRTLDTLCEKGMLQRSVLMDGGRALFETVPETHSHNLICTLCHRIVPIRDCPLADYESEIARVTGYDISGHKLEVYGVCPACRARRGGQGEAKK